MSHRNRQAFSNAIASFDWSEIYHKINKILVNDQFGFRKYHSSFITLMLLMNKLITSLENFEGVVGVFLDFSKAFDTLDQNYYWISWNIMKLGVMPSYGYNYILYYIYIVVTDIQWHPTTTNTENKNNNDIGNNDNNNILIMIMIIHIYMMTVMILLLLLPIIIMIITITIIIMILMIE